MVLDMVCNFKKCRKPLPTVAWVTSCSHAFCAEHGENEFGKKVHDILLCPACNSQLSDKFDVVQADLNPPETFKSIILSGMKPDVIMDIAMRAMSFWSYQMEEETRYQENIGRHARERAKGLEEFHNLSLQRVKSELQSNKKKIENLQDEYNKQKRQTEEYAVMLEEKNRKIQKLQHQLESQRRNSVHINDIDEVETRGRQNVGNIVTNRFKSPPPPVSKFQFQPQMMAKQGQYGKQMFEKRPLLQHNPNFTFNPVTPTDKQCNGLV